MFTKCWWWSILWHKCSLFGGKLSLFWLSDNSREPLTRFLGYYYKFTKTILAWVRPSPTFWQCQDFESSCSRNPSLRVLVIKRPQFYPNWIDPFFADWSDPESDDESGDVDVEQVFFCMQVTVNLIQIDTLEKASALVATKMKNPESRTVFGKPIPNKILSIVHNLTSKDLED